MVLYEISTNSIPFDKLTAMQIMNTFLFQQQKRPIIPDGVDSNIRKLIEESWQQESSKRPSIIQILAKLELLQLN